MCATLYFTEYRFLFLFSRVKVLLEMHFSRLISTEPVSGCPVLENPSNGIISYCSDGFNIGSSCSFICAVGFSMVGGANLTCASTSSGKNTTGQWDFEEPTCRSKARAFDNVFHNV